MIEDLTTTAACPTCRAPLAPDQRYCLYCGTRAPGARIDSLEALRADAAVPPPPAVLARPAAASPALPVLAVVAALGVGALLGHWATQTPQPAAATTPTTQVIRVTGDGAAPAATAAATAAPSATAAAAHHGSKAKAAATPTATPVKDLSKDSIKQAVKHKAPISTGGTPPPKDNKPAGGGSDFTTIG
jgi:hypothetical protein